MGACEMMEIDMSDEDAVLAFATAEATGPK